MLVLLTLSKTQPGRVVNELDNEIAGKTSNSCNGRLIKNFQSLKSTGCTEELSFQAFDQATSDFEEEIYKPTILQK